MAFAIILTAGSQVLIRSGAKGRTSVTTSFFHPLTMSGYFSFVIVVVLMNYALQQLLMSTVIAWNSLTYIATPLAGWFILKDKLTLRMFIGALLIVVGIIIFSQK